MSEEDLVRVEFVIPKELEESIKTRISDEVRNSYYGSVGSKVAERVKEALTEDGFCDRVSDAVLEKVKMSEDEYVSGVSESVKDALLKTTSVVAKEVLAKVEEKVKSYGFIKIGDSRY